MGDGTRGPRTWGGLARRGAGRLDDPEARGGGGGPRARGGAGSGGGARGRGGAGGAGGASTAWRRAVEGARDQGGAGGRAPGERPARDPRPIPPPPARKAGPPPRGERPEREPRATEEWILVEEVRDEADRAVRRGRSTGRAPEGVEVDLEPLSDEEAERQLTRGVPTGQRDRVTRRLRDAARNFDAERYTDAARILKGLADQAPGVPAVRELYGLTLYRQGRWRPAIKELEAFRTLSGSTEQHPVLADCYRALGQWAEVDELWEELRAASPSASLVTEGRIVAAGALADRGDLPGALRLLSRDWRFPKRPQDHHLRRAYALADLYERAGDVPRARDLFSRIRAVDPGFADVATRLRALR